MALTPTRPQTAPSGYNRQRFALAVIVLRPAALETAEIRSVQERAVRVAERRGHLRSAFGRAGAVD